MTDVLSVGAPTRSGDRVVRWNELSFEELTPRQRDCIAREWAHRTEQEHLAVGAFSMMTQELAEVGCEPVVLALMAKAACDEVRHTEICRRIAVAASDGERTIPSRFRGVPRIPQHADRSVEVRALLHAVEMCCLGETCTGVYLTAMHDRAENPTMRRALESLLEDEIDHGRVGWALLATSSRAARRIVADELPALVGRTIGRILDSSLGRERPDPALARHGYVGGADAVALYRSTLKDVVLPGFETAGIDLRPLRAAIVEKGWLA